MNNYYDRLKKQWEKEGMVKGKEEQKAEPSLTVENFQRVSHALPAILVMNKKVPVWALFSLGRILSLFINLKQFSTDTGGAPFSYFFARINWKYRKQA